MKEPSNPNNRILFLKKLLFVCSISCLYLLYVCFYWNVLFLFIKNTENNPKLLTAAGCKTAWLLSYQPISVEICFSPVSHLSTSSHPSFNPSPPSLPPLTLSSPFQLSLWKLSPPHLSWYWSPLCLSTHPSSFTPPLSFYWSFSPSLSLFLPLSLSLLAGCYLVQPLSSYRGFRLHSSCCCYWQASRSSTN